MSMWQRSMIACARSARLKDWAQGNRAGTVLARRYVGGGDIATGIERVLDLRTQQLRASLFFLGEYLADPETVERNVLEKIAVAKALGAAGLDVHISVDPTQIGQSIDPELARENVLRIARTIASCSQGLPGIHLLMLDMEDSSVTDATIALHGELRHQGLPAGITLQAYRRRTKADLERLIAQGAFVRLVRGAFAERGTDVLPSRREIHSHYRLLIEMMLSRDALRAGFRPSIATHDEALQLHAVDTAARSGWAPGAYEFEMLLGVRHDVARSLAKRGERVRLYVPFGSDWWPHAMRRIGENPRNALLLARSLMGAPD